VDLVKIDCISAPYKGDEIRMFSEALHKTTRPFVLSLSPGPTPIDEIANLRKYAQMWRISNDVWDHWAQWPHAAWSQGVLGQFTLAAEWASLAEPGHWPDADMLPFGFLGPRPGQGKTRTGALTADEGRTMMTLWCMMRSPLMIGTNLTRMDTTTHALLTNDEVITADQHSTGGRQMSNEGQKIVWASHGEKPGIAYVALFNTGDGQQNIEYPLQSLGLATTSFAIRDVWQHKDIGTADRVKATLRSHASALFRLTASK
jgi:hypothetical protein